MKLIEVQVDRLVGPTHHFGGLGVGNLASQESSGETSNPAAAALQGLDKMRRVAQLGVPQLVLPPQPSPDLSLLTSHGFGDDEATALRRAADEAPEILSAATTCSAMWTANAATVTPGPDGALPSTQVSIANLSASLHRSIESEQTSADLRAALGDTCAINDAFGGGAPMRDEGAANHMRLSTFEDKPSVNVLVYGDQDPLPEMFWPRQTLAASKSIARRHRLFRDNTFFLKQHPLAIDAGAFHNDVVAMSHGDILIHHEFAFDDDGQAIAKVKQRFLELERTELRHIVVNSQQLSLEDSVSTYLFNSQIVSPPESARPVIICPRQVRENKAARNLIRDWCQRGIFREACYVSLDESMSGGGGPACLRLRVPLPQDSIDQLPATYRWTHDLDQDLRNAIDATYPTKLHLRDLHSPDVLEQIHQAHATVASIFN